MGIQEGIVADTPEQAVEAAKKLKEDYNSDWVVVKAQIHAGGRGKGTFKNELEDIPGIGKTTADNLLKTFRSVKNIAAQTREALEAVIGKDKARIVHAYFHQSMESGS